MSGSFPKTRMSAFDSLEVGEIFFSNLLLLGFDPAAMERKHRIPFNKEMFALPNKKGFEAVALFLFTRLDEARCQEEFRDCWLVRDKKEEQMFRKVCNNWLAQIAKDDRNSFLPRIVSSLFMSPGGDKFTQFMLCFSRYVIHRVMSQEHGAKGVRDFLNHPLLTPQNYTMAPVIVNGIVAGSVRQRQKFVQVVQDSVFLHDEWNKYALDQIRDYRQKVKKLRDLSQAVNDENLKLAERGSTNSSPSQTKYKPGASVYDSEIQAVKRAQVVQQVRNMWKIFDDFRSIQSVDRDVIDSILQGTLEKYKVDASELNIKIPDLLLRRCEQELQRRNVDNIYQGGNVNLLSLIHLWNLSLHLYAEKLHEAGVPKMDSVVPNLTTMVEAHRSHCTNSENLRHQLELRLLPDLKQSIEHLKHELDKQLLSSVSPASIRLTTLGLGLVPPTPPLSFEPRDPGPTEKGHLVTEKLLRRNKNKVTTPDAASQLVKDISDKVLSQHSALAQGIPVYAPTDKIQGADKPTISTREVGHLQYSDVNRATKPKSVVKQPLRQEKITRLPAASNVRRSQQQKLPTAKQQLPLQTVTPKPVVAADSRHLPNSRNGKQVSSRPVVGKSSQPLVGKVDRHYGVIASKTQIQDDPLDVLAAKIASTVSLESPDGKEDNQKNSFENLYHEDVFQSREKLEHTPPSSKRSTWQDTRLSDSIGPLSSTHVESPSRVSADRRENEDVAVRLFSDKLSGGFKGATDAMSDETNSEENTSHISYSYQAFETNSPHSAKTPSTICSASPISSESEQDADDDRPSESQMLERRNSEMRGILKNPKSTMKDVGSKVDDSRVTNEEGTREKKDAVTEEANEAEVQEDAYEELSRHRHNGQNEMVDRSFRSPGFRTVDFVEKDHESVGNLYDNKRRDVADSLSMSEDGSLAHLNETLQFLRETKTPRLPNRVARLAGKRDLAVPNKKQLREAANQNFRHDLVTASEQFHPRVKDFLHDGNISLPVKLNSSDGDFIKAGDTSLRGNDSSNLSAMSLPIRGQMKVGTGNGEIDEQSENAQNGFFDLEKVSYSGSDLGAAGDCILNSSLQPKDRNTYSLTSSQHKSASELSVNSNSSSVDSLVLRYQKLRLQKDDAAERAGELLDSRQNLAAAPISDSLDRLNSSGSREGNSLRPREPMYSAGRNNSSALDVFSEPTKKAAESFETPSLNRRVMLQDEDFADIRLLLESSLTTSPNLNTSHRMSLQPGDYLMPSPLTDAVHSTDVSFARLNDSAINLLDVDASFLVPSSPANQDQMSVATGELIDFS